MQRVSDQDLRDAMRPSNILVQGKSGSGKTEMFRVIAKLFSAPMIRVEATRYTEVGYHGDDVTNIIVDLYKKGNIITHSFILKPILNYKILKLQAKYFFNHHM
jgi:ATP-dependent HslUV protease ATP-binding subunit HslU